MVEARKNTDKDEQRHDLFSGLLQAADDGEALNDEELLGGSLMNVAICLALLESGLPALLGNMFIFLIAGHEVESLPSSYCSP